MAQITSYGTLKTEVANFLNRTDLTADIPLFIQFAQKRIYRDLRVKAMEASFSSAIASGVIAVPTGYIEMKYAYVNISPVQKLERKDAEWIYYNYPTRSADGIPLFIAREAENFIFGPYPDSTYTIKGVYYKRLTAFSADADTNWFITDAPDLLLFASLLEAELFINNDQRATIWGTRYNAEKDRIQREDDAEEFSGGPISATVR